MTMRPITAPTLRSRLRGRGRATPLLTSLLLLPFAGSCAGSAQQTGAPAQRLPVLAGTAPVVRYAVTHTWPHDRQAFTEGLVIRGGRLFESTGLSGSSELRETDLRTGRVLRRERLPATDFGEGLTVLGGEIYQLTWRSHVGFVYDAGSFHRLRTFTYPTEGWGLTDDGTSLIMSDGTPTVRFLDPLTMHVRRSISVHDGGAPVSQVNELELVHGQLLATIWMQDRIATINPETGAVTRWLDLTGLLPPGERPDRNDVLNGIAYAGKGDDIIVTGKRWPAMFTLHAVAG